ncbi:MAG: hypothetical protein C0617_16160 [Desulfuromonas sp.]|uniref:selenite/tellurite reduction operon protein ExtJ n=1 Tax=Desulfuromonas sp. TaxID=892 RepID=UPI000CB9EB2E|nr:hypothetical protein [Desulfuromonas sp.]PLX81742.1 MAG: hypothetical protein C0617_16160 [Desulfuromonas sp.]
MKKQLFILTAVLSLALGGVAAAGQFEGEVVKVKGKKVTIEIVKGKASKIEVGSMVTLEVEAPAEAPEAGMDMLQGC